MEWALRIESLRHSEIWKFAMKDVGTPDVCIDTRLTKAVWTKGIRNVQVQLSRNIIRMKIC
jgi:large subunit ribosomal protein L31e